MRIRTHRLTLIILMQLALLCHTPGLLWAESRIGSIKHVIGRNAVVTLGIRDGVTVGLQGEVFREEMVEGQPVISKLAELTVIESYPDSAVIEIRMRFAPVREGDQVRVDNVIVPRTIVPEEEKPVPVESLEESFVMEQKKPLQKYRIGIGGGPVIDYGSNGPDVGLFGYGLNVYLERTITRRFAIDASLSHIRFPEQKDFWTFDGFQNVPVKYWIKYFQWAIRLKLIVSESPLRIYLHAGPSFSLLNVELIYEEGHPDLDEIVDKTGIQAGLGLDFPISRSFLLGLDIDIHPRNNMNPAIENAFGEWDGIGIWNFWVQVKYKL